MITWADVERSLRQRAYATLDDDPRILLETDAVFTVHADLIYARLFGFEDEIVRDGMQLTRAEPMILLPIPPRIPLDGHRDLTGLGMARYMLQSAFTVLTVTGEPGPPQHPAGAPVRVAYLRYKRRA